MRVYHRLIHIRDQRERHEDIPTFITEHPVFKLTTAFRLHVQKQSAPIRKNSSLIVDGEGMQIFAQLASVLREQGNIVMIYLVACILERLFGPDMIEDIEGIRGDLSIQEIVDGFQSVVEDVDEANMETDVEVYAAESISTSSGPSTNGVTTIRTASNNAKPIQSNLFGLPPNASTGAAKSAFSNIPSSQNAFGSLNVFGGGSFGVGGPAPAASQMVSVFSPSALGGPNPASAQVSPTQAYVLWYSENISRYPPWMVFPFMEPLQLAPLARNKFKLLVRLMIELPLRRQATVVSIQPPPSNFLILILELKRRIHQLPQFQLCLLQS